MHSGDTQESQSQALPFGATPDGDTPTNTANCAKDGTSTPGKYWTETLGSNHQDFTQPRGS
jgi:hypothetical protein